MRAAWSAWPLMTINNIHVLAGGRLAAQLVLADRSQADSTIAGRAIGRLYPDLQVRPVTNLAEAKRVLIRTRRATALVALADPIGRSPQSPPTQMLALFALCAYGTVDINHGWMDGADGARGLPLSASLL